MFSHGRIAWCWGTTLLAGAVGVALLAAGDLAGQPPGGQGYAAGGQQAPPERQPFQVAERSTIPPPSVPSLRPGDPNEHPLMPALRWAREGLARIEKIQDYSATLVKRERIGSKLGDYQYMFVKVRHKPFSVYMNFLAPAAVKGPGVHLRRRGQQRQDVGPRRRHPARRCSAPSRCRPTATWPCRASATR